MKGLKVLCLAVIMTGIQGMDLPQAADGENSAFPPAPRAVENAPRKDDTGRDRNQNEKQYIQGQNEESKQKKSGRPLDSRGEREKSQGAEENQASDENPKTKQDREQDDRKATENNGAGEKKTPARPKAPEDGCPARLDYITGQIIYELQECITFKYRVTYKIEMTYDAKV